MVMTVLGRLADQRGIETLEWIVIGAMIVALGIAIYPGSLQTQLTATINAIGGTMIGLGS
jgi:hypothetical protein